MHTAQWIIDQMESFAPACHAEEWDNVGLLVGDTAQPVKKILVALDLTEEVLHEAVSGGFDFIICHHPIIYNPIKRVTTDDMVGRKIFTLIRNGIGCFCSHTNIDKAPGGVNDCLAEKIGLTNIRPLIAEIAAQSHNNERNNENSLFGIGRIGELPAQMPLAQLAAHVKSALSLEEIRLCGQPEKTIKTVALCGGDGTGSQYMKPAILSGADVYITGDLRYHCAQEAVEAGLSLLDITHYGGEILIVEKIVSILRQAAKTAGFSALEIFPTSIYGQVFMSM